MTLTNKWHKDLEEDCDKIPADNSLFRQQKNTRHGLNIKATLSCVSWYFGSSLSDVAINKPIA